MSGPYDDSINLSHPTSAKHLRMPLTDRAAQSPPLRPSQATLLLSRRRLD